MGAEIEGRILPNDHLLRKLKMSLASRDAEIKVLKSQLEETTRAAAEEIEALKTRIKYYMHHSPQKRKSRAAKPRAKKPTVETKAEEAQGVRESVDEDPVGPPIST
jgi:hypothetical protein